MSAVAEATTSSFAERGYQLLERIDYRRADTEAEKEAIYRLRYQAYRAEGAITANLTRSLSDRFDEAENAWTFGLYVDGDLLSSIRVVIGSPEHPQTPAVNVFPDILGPEIEAGKTIVDPNRFVTDAASTRLYPELPYLTVRLGFVACGHFNTDIGAATPRTEHEAFYRRVFRMSRMCPPRLFPSLLKPHSLMAVHYPSVREKILERYPFFWSTFFERRMLFERFLTPLRADNDQLVPVQPQVSAEAALPSAA